MLQENISLLPYNSFRIQANAKYFAAFQNIEQLESLLADYRTQSSNQLFILGGGSNILLTKDVDGVVLKNELTGIELIHEDDAHYYVRAHAGTNWHAFVTWCVSNNYAGLENLSLIPGNVGASPMQNIGAYGVEVKDLITEVSAYHIKEKSIRQFTNSDCAFGYRESIFKRTLKGQYIILSVTFRLNKKPNLNTSYGAIEQELIAAGIQQPGIKDIAAAVIRIRQSKLPDPKQIGNAGSFFKNPVIDRHLYESLKSQYPQLPSYPAESGKMKIAAGWLIEQCGWKGYRKLDAGCHDKQALVLVNYGSASGKELFDLSEAIIASVAAKFSITLEREVNIL
jgi:UDP-N-acetylmuramate dehydrogenase